MSLKNLVKSMHHYFATRQSSAMMNGIFCHAYCLLCSILHISFLEKVKK